MSFDIKFFFFVTSFMELVINLVIVTVLGHMEGNRATLLFDHGKVLYIFISVKE